MAPPKKDAFADLFQSVNTSNRNKNLVDLQKERNGHSGTSSPSSVLQPMNKQGAGAGSSWDQFDIFTGSNSVSSSRGPTPANGNDPFDIFNSVSSDPEPKPQTDQQVEPVSQSAPISHTSSIQNSSSGVNLLDDEFTDAFQETEPELKPKPVQETTETFDYGVQQQSRQERRYEERSEGRYEGRQSRQSSSSPSERDEIVAELIDMGFPIDVSNDAIDSVGMDLQACVNFIMSGGKQGRSKSSRPTRSSTQSPHNEDIGAKINDLSSDFFNKASIFLNKSKETVIKNFEQFQQTQGHPNARRGSPNNSMPAWMQNQEKYKSKASEKKPNGEKFEDYGSDEENIDQESIRRFMEDQRAKDKAKSKARMENMKAMARERISGNQVSPQGTGERQERRESPRNTSRDTSRDTSGEFSRTQPKVSAPSSNRSSNRSSPSLSQPAPVAAKQDADLLGLRSSLTPAERFKAKAAQEEVYVSSRRRRPVASTTSTPKASTKPKPTRKTTKQSLDQFSQSDYETSKEKATVAFTNGAYDEALINYTKCLNSLPPTHELRVVINSNLAVTLNKLGDHKQAKDHCNQGLDLISSEEVNDAEYIISEKPIKSWYIKLLSRKAEALEMMELFADSLACLTELVTKLGVNDKKVMDARRRVNNIVNPPPKPAPKPRATRPTKPSNNENLKRVQEQNKQQEKKDTLKYKYQEVVENKVFAWSNGKEDNLRSLLIALPDVLPSSLGFPFLTTKKITISDLMLPKKVKINYMKVISSIHPDKLGNLDLNTEHEMLCQSVFITLNKSWDLFKEQNGIN